MKIRKKFLLFVVATLSLFFVTKNKVDLVNAATTDNVFVRGNSVLKTIVSKLLFMMKMAKILENIILHIPMYI
ncbi:MAG: hypothetical protein Q3960_04410 [Lactobacillus sp.]|nr:hypothetical protein [Lactobacillus sp.]